MLPAETPGRVRELLRRCLERDPRQRLRDIGDARVELELAKTGPQAREVTAAHRPGWVAPLITGALGLAAGAVLI